ncbi:hypothetical protein PFAG_06025, partial [Plasmodium falciparum Santa Lucia]
IFLIFIHKLLLELSSQGTLNHLSKLDSQHSLLIHYNNN